MKLGKRRQGRNRPKLMALTYIRHAPLVLGFLLLFYNMNIMFQMESFQRILRERLLTEDERERLQSSDKWMMRTQCKERHKELQADVDKLYEDFDKFKKDKEEANADATARIGTENREWAKVIAVNEDLTWGIGRIKEDIAKLEKDLADARVAAEHRGDK